MAPIEKGSTVLVTGINGYIASHIADQLLQAGFKVNGTVRTESKGQWVQDHFDTKYGTDKVKLFVVPDMAVKDAFNESVKGCSGVAHVASNLNFSSDPNDVIPGVLKGIQHTLEAAEGEPSVKRFVYTSSSTAALNPVPDKVFDFDETTWNQDCVERAWAPPPYDDSRKWDVYGASKTQAEQELWKFAKEKKPHFEVNAVLPNANFGPIIDSENQHASTAGWITTIYKSGFNGLDSIPPQYFINVQDTARLHVAALVDPDIKDERIFGFAQPYNWNDVLHIMRKLRPDHKVPEDLPSNSKDLSNPVARARAEDILRKHYKKGFTGLEESIEQTIEGL